MASWIFQHLGEIPRLIIWVIGIALSINYWKQNPRKFLFILIACSLFLIQQLTGTFITDWWNSQAVNPSVNRLESYSTFHTTQTILSIIWILAWGILFYAIFNPKINHAELIKGLETKVYKYKKYIWFLLIIFLPAVACGSVVLPILNGCQDVIPYRRNVDVAPFMNLVIPADLDLSQWTDTEAGLHSIGGRGIFTNVERFPNIVAADDEFHYGCEHAQYQPNVIYGGQESNRYCISSVDTVRSDPEGLCSSLGYYSSYVIIQKADVIIEIFEESSNRNSFEKDATIAKLVAEINQAIEK